ncbi:RHS repeat protein [Paenibacillus sepulcri]|uniref:Teneurin-like YD-shell domain-containing protein n=1 Tax=Paenibacillus sepulcri TaxID=359917 RepID=A0ABS7BXM6_9BACL|nr:hypothetical protein [Paenibacillus sepulcri]
MKKIISVLLIISILVSSVNFSTAQPISKKNSKSVTKLSSIISNEFNNESVSMIPPSDPVLADHQPNPIIFDEKGGIVLGLMPQVVDVVYRGVTGSVYGKPTVSDSVYGRNLSAFAINATPTPTPDMLSAIKNLSVKNTQAPFQINKGEESISSMNGSLSLDHEDLFLPGRNGLSFSLTRYYDSSSSNLYEKELGFGQNCLCAIYFDADVYTETYNSNTGAASKSLNYSGTLRMTYLNVNDNSLFDTYDGDRWIGYINVHAGKEGFSSNWSNPDSGGTINRQVQYIKPNPNAYMKDESQIPYPPTIAWKDVATAKTYEEKLYPIGKGWSWDIPYIKTEPYTNTSYLSLGRKGTYEIGNGNGLPGYSLVGYPWKDLYIGADQSVVVNEEQSWTVVRSIEGISQYFAQDGRLIQISDPYNNTIQFKYAEKGKYGKVLISITDAIQNSINIDYDDSGVTLRQGDQVVRYNKSFITRYNPRPGYEALDTEVLTKVTDQAGRETSYWYEERNTKFSVTNATPLRENAYLLLGRVTYPTGAYTSYTYEPQPVTRPIGKEAVEQEYRVASREDVASSKDIETGIYNKSSFTYQSDMSSTYGQDIASFGSTMSNGYLTTKYDYEKDFIDEDTPAVIYAKNIVESAGDESRTTAYLYDRVRKITLPIQTTSTYRKGDRNGTPAIDKVAYDDYGNILMRTDVMGIPTNYTYDPTTHLLKNVSEKVNANVTRNTDYIRNDKGTITEFTIIDQTGTLLAHSKYEDIDIYGNIKRSTIYDDNQSSVYLTEYGYSGAFPTKQSINVTNADQQTNTIIQQLDYDPTTGRVTSYTDGKEYTTRYQYDKLGRLITMTNPDQSSKIATYDDANNTVRTTDETGVRSTQSWDSLGRKIFEGIFDTTSTTMSLSYKYDDIGRLKLEEEAGRHQTTYEYNAWNQLIKTNLPTPKVSSSNVKYDKIERTITTTDPEGIQTLSYYDLLGRQTATKIDINEGKGFQNVNSTQYDYMGNTVVSTDAQYTTSYVNDALGRLTKVTNPKQESTSYFYSLAGNLKTILYPDGRSIHKQADQLGRLIKETDQTGQVEKSYYDANDNIERSVDKKGQLFTYQYNNRNLLIFKNSPFDMIGYGYDQAGRRKMMVDSTGLTSYNYKPTTGELTDVTFPDKKKITYTYNSQGLRETMTDPFGYRNVYTYDGMNRLQTVGPSMTKFDAEYEYYNNNMLKNIKQLNGNTSTYTYDGYSIDTLTQNKSNGVELNFFDYGYDGNMNMLTQVAKQNGASGPDGPDGSDQTFGYTYDALNRIETSTQFMETYGYDNRGNRLTLQSETNAHVALGDTSYAYDDWNQLTSVAKDTGEKVSYKYNGDGLLVERMEDNATVRYYYDGDQVVAEGKVINGVVSAKAQYIRGQGLVAGIGSSGKYYYLQNGHGDVVELRDSTGNTSLNRYTYDMWGNPLTTVETIANPFRYSGEMWDQTAGLQYLRARWYDPSMGRFISEDTYEGQINNPLTQNLYVYTANNPLRYSDPSGHCFWDACILEGVAVYALVAGVVAATVVVGAYASKALDDAKANVFNSEKADIPPAEDIVIPPIPTPSESPNDFIKQRGNQGYKEKSTGLTWKKDQLHKDHWDLSDSKGKKVKEVDFNGKQIWPNGNKNKNKK